jgi:hypothetical protein
LPDVLFACKSTINFGWGRGVIVSVGAGVTVLVPVTEGNALGDGELVREGMSVTATDVLVENAIQGGVDVVAGEVMGSLFCRALIKATAMVASPEIMATHISVLISSFFFRFVLSSGFECVPCLDPL